MTINKLSEYGHGFQIKVLASLLTDKKFLQNISDVLTPDYFESEAHKWIIKYTLDYSAKYNTYPTMDVLHVEIQKIRKEPLKVSIIENLREAYSSTQEDIEYVQEEFFNFCKNQAIKGALLQSVELLNEGLFSDIRRVMDSALKAGSEKNIGHDYNKDIEERFREDDKKIITFPWPVFNKMTDGGLGPGDLMLLFAPPGVGKTTVVANIAAHALKCGKNVIFYTLELSEAYIGRKIDSILTGIPMKELPLHRRRVEEMLASLPGKLIIKEYGPRKASLDTLRAHSTSLKCNEGFEVHLKIIDYPELLKPRQVRKELREEIDDVYVEIKGDAMEDEIPYVCPSQINRMGAKDDIIEGDKVAGSYGKMMIGSLNISLSRLRKDKIQGTGRFHFIKSRLGPDGMTYSAKIDLARGFIEISDEEYVEGSDQEEPARVVNGQAIYDDDLQQLRGKFRKFERPDNVARLFIDESQIKDADYSPF